MVGVQGRVWAVIKRFWQELVPKLRGYLGAHIYMCLAYMNITSTR